MLLGLWLVIRVCSLSVLGSCACSYVWQQLCPEERADGNELPAENPRIRQLCGVTKGLDEKIDEGVLRCGENGERQDC